MKDKSNLSYVFKTLQERPEMGNVRSADLFVSVHLNSSGSSSASGTEVYYYAKKDDDNYSRDVAKFNSSTVDSGIAMSDYALKDIIAACDYYFKKTGRRVSYEYSLVAGVNDNMEEAKSLVRLVNGRNVHINLIPVNPIKERDFKQSDKLKIKAFRDFLEKKGVNATIRREMGRDVDGACGQLRRRFIESSNKSESLEV